VPAHTAAWNNLSPVGSDLASSIDDFMRAMKVDIDERMSLQHYWGDAIAVGNNQDGTHKEITITPATTNTPLIKTNANQSLTGSDASSTIDLGITWNTSGAPTAIKANVTNTASGAASKLLDLQVGGTSMFHVDKSGNAVVAGTSTLTGNTQVGAGSGSPSLIINGNGNQVIEFQANSVATARMTSSGGNEHWDSNGNWAWRSLNTVSNRMVLTSAGALTVTGSLTSAGAVFSSNVRVSSGSYMRADGAGAALTLGNGTNQLFGTTEFRDSGGSTLQWQVPNHILPGASATYDIGSGAVRVRTIYAVSMDVLNGGGSVTGSGGSLVLPGNLVTGGDVTIDNDGSGLLVGGTFNQQAVLFGRGSGGEAPHLQLQKGDSQCAYIELETNGTFYALWVDSSGKLRVNTAPPANAGGTGTGTVVGTQV
jgi:hypothetical protein